MSTETHPIEGSHDFIELAQLRVAESERLLAESGPKDALDYLSQFPEKDMADIVFLMHEQGRSDFLLTHADAETIATIVSNLIPENGASLIATMNPERVALALDAVQPDTAADLLRSIDWENAGKILANMKSRRSLGELLLYPDDQAGGLMSTNLVALRDKWSVNYALNVMRMSHIPNENMRQLFAVDESNRLVGVLELSELMFAQPGTKIADIMHPDVISVQADTDQEEAALIAQRYNLVSMPVVDVDGRLEGVIMAGSIRRVTEEEATEDMLRMAGVAGTDSPRVPIIRSVRNRLPWLVVNVAAVAFVALFIGLFQDTLDALAILAVYLPMVMNQAGVVGTQISTVMVRYLAIGGISDHSARRTLVREYGVAAVNSVLVSFILALIVGLWRQDFYFGVVIFCAMMVSYFVAASGGVLIPMAMRRFKIDPAAASGVVLSTLTDLTGGVSYLGFATLFLNLLRG